MNKFLKTFFLIFLIVFALSCEKNDDASIAPLRDYAEQYATDIENIENFLKTHYIEVINNPGATEDMNVTYTEIPVGGTQTSIWEQTTYPLQNRTITVKQNNVDISYKIYYLKFRDGSSTNTRFPCNVDNVLTSYNGKYISKTTENVDGVEVEKIKLTQFEESLNPQRFLSLREVIRGWSEIFPLFSTGSYGGNPDGTTSYFDFGAGAMFIPSGLGYFGSPTASIPVYSPLIFSFKLYEIERTDQDGDGIFSHQEDLNNDGYVYVLGEDVVNIDDTDGDEVPDFLDIDDDGDFFTTLGEIKNPITGNPFPFDEIPTCVGGTKKRYLDKNCHN